MRNSAEHNLSAPGVLLLKTRLIHDFPRSGFVPFSSTAQSAYGASVCRFWMMPQERTGTSASWGRCTSMRKREKITTRFIPMSAVPKCMKMTLKCIRIVNHHWRGHLPLDGRKSYRYRKICFIRNRKAGMPDQQTSLTYWWVSFFIK